MANNKSATPAQRVAQKYNYELRQLKGMEAQLGQMRESANRENTNDPLYPQLVNIWVGHCLDGIAELRTYIKACRDAKIKHVKEQAE